MYLDFEVELVESARTSLLWAAALQIALALLFLIIVLLLLCKGRVLFLLSHYKDLDHLHFGKEKKYVKNKSLTLLQLAELSGAQGQG